MRAEPADNIIWICPITIGEIEAGLRMAQPIDEAKQRACREFLYGTAVRFVHSIEVTTGRVYAEVLEQICKKYPRHGEKTQGHLTDRQIDIHDRWIAAVAVEHNLILLTNDGMEKIRECLTDLRTANWLA